MEEITITKAEYDELKAKAAKLDRMTAKVSRNLPNAKRTPAERSEAARRAVAARWARAKGKQQPE